MAKKQRRPTHIPDFMTLIPAQQDRYIERYKTRKGIRDANVYLVELLVAWLIDIVPDRPGYARFHAAGAVGHFGVAPTEDFTLRMQAKGLTPKEIEDALKKGERSLDYMPPEIEVSVFDRIQRMTAYLKTAPRGTFEYSCAVYEAFGRIVRAQFIQQYGYPPEQYQTEDDKITGDEPEWVFQPLPHQTSLFAEDEE